MSPPFLQGFITVPRQAFLTSTKKKQIRKSYTNLQLVLEKKDKRNENNRSIASTDENNFCLLSFSLVVETIYEIIKFLLLFQKAGSFCVHYSALLLQIPVLIIMFISMNENKLVFPQIWLHFNINENNSEGNIGENMSADS